MYDVCMMYLCMMCACMYGCLSVGLYVCKLCLVLLCCVVFCCVMLCYAMVCYVMLCYVDVYTYMLMCIDVQRAAASYTSTIPRDDIENHAGSHGRVEGQNGQPNGPAVDCI